MDASLPVAQALAVKDGRIVEFGGTDEVLWLREDDYEVIDLEGRTVVPGYVDPHNHFSIGAFETLWADCGGARSAAYVQRALALGWGGSRIGGRASVAPALRHAAHHGHPGRRGDARDGAAVRRRACGRRPGHRGERGDGRRARLVRAARRRGPWPPQDLRGRC